MRLKTSIQIIVASTALVLITTISLAETIKVPYVSISGSKPRYGSARKRAPLGETSSMSSSSTCREAR